MVALTIGMATYDDFDGVYFTIQALRLYQDLTGSEILVIDNFGCEPTRQFVEGFGVGRYVLATGTVGTAAAKNLVFAEARGEAVLCCDSHVFLAPGAIARLKAYYRDTPDCRDLLQGPLIYDDLRTISTHFDPVWRGQMWGTWASDPRGQDPEGEPFDIPMQGMGVFSCRKETWPGFNPCFRGFGGEEGYIHEKFRQRGARTLCLPWLRWVHRFGRPRGVPYPLTVEMKLRNYIIGFTELGLDTTEAETHFSEFLPPSQVASVKAEALADYAAHALPLISCICPTFGRPPKRQHRLEEAIQSFLLQDYPNKELIIVNDCPGQDLVCEAPGVRVVNLPDPFPSLADKLNAGVALATGDLIAPWSDADISLPWRLSCSLSMLGDADYSVPNGSWVRGNGVPRDEPSSIAGLNQSLIRREALCAAGGFQSVTMGEDSARGRTLCATVAIRGERASSASELPREDWFLIHHLDESARQGEGNPDPQLFWTRAGKQPFKPGRYVLRPRWRVDYVAEVDASLRARIRVAVLGDTGDASGQRVPFVRDDPRPGELAEQHLARVREQVAVAMSQGATHLLIPRDEANWLGNHPHLEEYFSREHDFVDTGQELGVVFALRSPAQAPMPNR